MTDNNWLSLTREYPFDHVGWFGEDGSGVLILRENCSVTRYRPVSRPLYRLCVDHCGVPQEFTAGLGAATAHIAEEPSDTPVAEFQKLAGFSPTERSCYWGLFASLCSQYGAETIRLATGYGSLSRRADVAKHRERTVCALALTLEHSRNRDFSGAVSQASRVFPTLSEDADICDRLSCNKHMLDRIASCCLDTQNVLERDISAYSPC